MLQDSTTALGVLSNDSGAPDSGETLSVTLVSTPAHGTATITGGGASISYASTAGYTGSDSFTYTISDGNGGTDSADVAISVQAVNTKPVNTLPGPQTRSEDSQLLFSVRAGTRSRSPTPQYVSVRSGVGGRTATFTWARSPALTPIGTGTASVSAQGTLAALNIGLNKRATRRRRATTARPRSR